GAPQRPPAARRRNTASRTTRSSGKPEAPHASSTAARPSAASGASRPVETAAAGQLPKKRITSTSSVVGNQAIQPTITPSGASGEAAASSAVVISTADNSGKATTCATGETNETTWNVLSMTGRVARVTASVSPTGSAIQRG